MDKQVCLMLIRQELIDLYHQRVKFIKACEASDFREMGRIISMMEYTTIVHLHNLVARDGYEDWGRAAIREKLARDKDGGA